MPEQQIQIALEPAVIALTGAQLTFDEEQFYLMTMSGNAGRRYALSPKHAKRLMFLLNKIVGEYETKFGKLKTELMKENRTEEKDEFGFSAK
jgi:hypothetical protein